VLQLNDALLPLCSVQHNLQLRSFTAVDEQCPCSTNILAAAAAAAAAV
jgi:hypothetical protein